MIFSLHNKTILITGGTGSWGKEFTHQLLTTHRVKEVRIYSRGEYHQVEMRRAFQNYPRLSFIIGDVRDKDRLIASTRNVDVIVHLAALKHIPVVEEHLWEALQTNTLGTHYVIEAAQTNGVERILYVSSDKAVDPLNFYGITKLASERLVIAANKDSSLRSRFIVYRGGNVMGSAGSVIPLFQTQLVSENSITITDPGMTRFFISKREVVRRALKALSIGMGGEIFIPKMKAASLDLLSRIMIKTLGEGKGDRKTQIKRIAVRPGEKYAEILISRNEANRTRELPDMWVILPFFSSPLFEKCYAKIKRADFEDYRSDTGAQFSPKELEALLREEGFLSRVIAPSYSPFYFKKGKWFFH